MKKSLMSLLLVGSLLAPGALQTIEATGTGTGASYTLIDEVKNDDGTVTKTLLTNYGSTIIQTVDSDGNVISQTESDPVVPPTSFDDERVYIEQVTYTEPVNFDTREQETDQLPEGEVVVQTEGVAGVRTFYIDMAYWKNGEIVYNEAGNPLVREYNKITQAPVDKLILTGTGIMGEDVDTTRIDIPFETKVVENDELPVGTEEVSQEGVNGWYELTTIYETKDGERTGVIIGEEGAETDRKEPVNKIIQKGTKEVADEFVVTATLVDEEGNALAGEVLTITGEDVEQELTTDENGVVTFSVPNGTYTVSFGDVSASVTVEDENASVELVGVVEDEAFTREDLLGRGDDLITFETQEDAQAAIDALDKEDQEGLEVKETEDGLFYVAHVIPAIPIEPIPYSREDLLGRDDDLITFDTEDEAQAAIEALDEEDQDGLEVKETDDGLFYVAHVISATPIEPIEPVEPGDNFHVNVVKNDFPQFDAEGNEYEVVIGEEATTITITDKDGKLVAVIEYNEDTQTTKIKAIPATPIQPGVNTKDIVDGIKEKFPTFDNEDYTYETEVTETKVIVTIKNKEGHLVAVVEYDREKEAYSVKPAELTPAKPIEKDEETTVEDEEESEVVAGQPIQVKRTDSVDSRANLPETGELGGGLTIMAALLAGLGGLGLLFKRRS